MAIRRALVLGATNQLEELDPADTLAGATPGTDVQPFDATLSALAAANWVLNAIPIGSGANTVAQITFAANTFPARSSTGDLVAKAISNDALAFVAAANNAAMRASLGGTTVGQAFFTLTNPGAVTFPRIDAANTVTARSAANYRTDLGLGTSATVNTGTSGATIPLLNGNNTYSGAALFTGTLGFQNNSGNTFIQVSDNNGANFATFGSISGGNAYMYGGAGKQLRFYPNGANTITMTSAGMAIGTTTGAQDLVVNGAAASNKTIGIQAAGTNTFRIISVSGNSYADFDGALFFRPIAGAPTYGFVNASGFNFIAPAGYPGGFGAGGAVTQATSKSTGVTLNTPSGRITMHNASLAANTVVTFTLTNSSIAANDTLILSHAATGTLGTYILGHRCAAGSATISVHNATGGALAEAVQIQYNLIRGSQS